MTWITVKEAAALYGLSTEYFRRNFCDPGGIMDKQHALRTRKGPKDSRRKIQVLREAILEMIDRERSLAS